MEDYFLVFPLRQSGQEAEGNSIAAILGLFEGSAPRHLLEVRFKLFHGTFKQTAMPQ